MLQAETAEL